MNQILKVANQFATKLAADEFQNEMWAKYYPIVTVQFFGEPEEPIDGWEEPEVLALSLKQCCDYFYNMIGKTEIDNITGEVTTVKFGWIEGRIIKRGKGDRGNVEKNGFSNQDVASCAEAYDTLLNWFLEIFGNNFDPERLGKGKRQ
jgi:hypothetical protein